VRKAALAAIAALLDHDERIVFIGSDLGAGTMSEAATRHPHRVLMEGIAEQHLIGCAAGMALEGYVPFVHTIGTFLTRRALEQVIVDVALHRLPVRLIAAGGGMVYAPLGPTHEAIDDFALMRAIPGMAVIAPADPIEMHTVIDDLATAPGPAYVRVAKGGEPDITSSLSPLRAGRPRPVIHGGPLVVLTTGALLHECTSAVEVLRAAGTPKLSGGSGSDDEVGLWHLPYLAPLKHEDVAAILAGQQAVLVVEEHIPSGGLGTIVAEAIVTLGLRIGFHHLSLPHRYSAAYGSQRDHWAAHGLTAEGIAATLAAIPGGGGRV